MGVQSELYLLVLGDGVFVLSLCYCLFVCLQIDGDELQSEFKKLKFEIKDRPAYYVNVHRVIQLATILNKTASSRRLFPELLKTLDWLLAIPMSNAGATIPVCFSQCVSVILEQPDRTSACIMQSVCIHMSSNWSVA